MGDGSAIEWTDATWNPLVGCSRVSKGCEHCYAEGVAHRGMVPHHRGLTVLAPHGKGPRWTGEVRFVPELLGKPLSWRKPRRVFVNSMSDLFHEAVPFEQIAAVFGVMAACPHHTFQVLTKRPERARAFLTWIDSAAPPYPIAERASRGGTYRAPTVCVEHAWTIGHPYVDDDVLSARWCDDWPLPNVWLGVSVEDQATADERIPVLLELPAAIRWVSYEPALGPVDFGLSSASCDCCPRWSSRWVRLDREVRPDHLPFLAPGDGAGASPGVWRAESNRHGALSVPTCGGRLLGIKPDEFEALPGLDWIVVGGESGPRARPFDLAWARSALAQGRAAGVPVFVKQLGARPTITEDLTEVMQLACGHLVEDGVATLRLRDRKGGDMAEWPEDLGVRELPEVRS